MILKRRDFLKVTSLAAASLMIPNFLKALATSQVLDKDGKVLVVLQMSGGNDGLNTVIPMRNDIYFKGRNTISISKAIPLDDESGINPALSFFKELFDRGELAIMNNVGYPHPDMSHFRSMDIWQTASGSDQYLDTGWLGRYLDEACYNCERPTQAMEINDMLSLSLKGKNEKAFAFRDPTRLYQTANENYFKVLADNYRHHDVMADYLYQTLSDTINNAGYIYKESSTKETPADYPDSQLGHDLKTIATLIKSDINSRVYYAEIGSFDTHVDQVNRQTKLFTQMNEAIKAFVADMRENKLFQNVLLMTFSEFGRRVAQNASGGTDHGTANQMFFISGGLKKKGHLNPLPDLQHLAEGNLIYSEDFRKVYATVLKNWLGANSSKILGWQNGLYDFI